MIEATYECDVLVIGSGVSGYCAAIQAGRCGCDTILVEKDEVLGGNSGPNLGVGITGADRYNPFGTETGLIHELQEDAAWVGGFTWGAGTYSISRRNEAVVQEHLERAGVRVLKRHYARTPIVEGSRIVGAVVEDLAAFRTVQINVGHLVIEASGDGHIGALAGADFDMGSEGRTEFGERSALPERTALVQGTSLVALAHQTDREVVFEPPADTPPYNPRVWLSSLSSYLHHHDRWFSGPRDMMFLYVTETGGHMDTIKDDVEIYEMLLKQLWAEWDHIKNGPHREEARCWDLLWVSPKAGKRESRRFLGDYVLTQTDLEEGKCLPDDVAYGGHDLDDHRPLGDSADIFAHSVPPMYGIPYRACYSRNVDNLLLAGRLISATHLAHSSTRLMRTGGAIGQAVGLAAALCCEHQCTPREVYTAHIDELQSRLLKADATILCAPVDPTGDIARQATVSASSELHFNNQEPGQWVPLISAAGNVLWDWPARLEQVELCLKNASHEPHQLRLSILRAHREPRWKTMAEIRTYGRHDLRDSAFRCIATVETELPADHEGWHTIVFPEPLEIRQKDPASDDDRVIIALEKNPDVSWAVARRGCDIAEMVEHGPQSTSWKRIGALATMRLAPAPRLGEAANATNGFHRRLSTAPTNMWMSDPCQGLPQDLLLTWEEPQEFDQVCLTFDNLTRLRHENPWESGQRVLPICARAYELTYWQDGEWHELVRAENNHHRFRRHAFRPVTGTRLRLRVLEAHGDQVGARVYQVRVSRTGGGAGFSKELPMPRGGSRRSRR